MEMKNICGKIPMELHAKVREEIEHREISTQEFLQQVIEEHFMEKGVDSMAARTIAVQVTEELFGRLKAAVAWKGCKQKDFLISVIEKAIDEIEDEQRRSRLKMEAEDRQQEETEEEPEDGETEEEPEGDTTWETGAEVDTAETDGEEFTDAESEPEPEEEPVA